MQLWNFQKPEETEQKFKELLPGAIASGNRAYYGELLTQIARTQGLQRKFDQAHQTLDLASAYLDASPKVQIRYNLERGRAFNSDKQIPEALSFFRRAVLVSESNNEDNLLIDALHMLAIAEKPENKLQHEYRALDIAEKSNDPNAQKWLGSLYNNMGWSNMSLEKFDEAQRLFQLGLDWQIKNGSERTTNIAKWTIGRVHRAKGNYEIALDKMEKLLEEKGGTDPTGFTYEEIGENLFALNRQVKASKYFGLAHEILSKDQWVSKNEPERVKRLLELSKLTQQ